MTQWTTSGADATGEGARPTCPRRYADDDEPTHIFVIGRDTCLCGKQRRMGSEIVLEQPDGRRWIPIKP